MGARVVAQHGRNDAGRAVRRCRHDTSPCGVLFVYRDRKCAHQVHQREITRQFAVLAQTGLLEHCGCAPLQFEHARQRTFRAQSTLDASFHDVPYFEQASPGACFILKRKLIFENNVGNAASGALAAIQQFLRTGEGTLGVVNAIRTGSGACDLSFVHHRATANREIGTLLQYIVMIIRCDAHAIRVLRQRLRHMKLNIPITQEGDFMCPVEK
ncbi:MAG: hypothetical protein ACD_10C00509G0006 [uncultured bacterium]|nr:MAG: hypothetical protein ACD_10C00509G0006 [uncultured bacterium]